MALATFAIGMALFAPVLRPGRRVRPALRSPIRDIEETMLILTAILTVAGHDLPHVRHDPARAVLNPETRDDRSPPPWNRTCPGSTRSGRWPCRSPCPSRWDG